MARSYHCANRFFLSGAGEVVGSALCDTSEVGASRVTVLITTIGSLYSCTERSVPRSSSECSPELLVSLPPRWNPRHLANTPSILSGQRRAAPSCPLRRRHGCLVWRSLLVGRHVLGVASVVLFILCVFGDSHAAECIPCATLLRSLAASCSMSCNLTKLMAL